MWHRHSMKPTYPAVPSQTGHRGISSDVSCHHPAPPAASWPTWPHSHLPQQPITLRPGGPAGKTPAPPAPRCRAPWHAPGIAALPDLAACWVELAAVLAGTDPWWDALPTIIQHQPLGAVAARDADVVKAGAGAGPVQAQVGAGPAAGAAALLVHLAPSALSACRDGHGAGTSSSHPAQPCTALHPSAWPYPSHSSCSVPCPSAHPSHPIPYVLFHPLLPHSSHHSHSISSHPIHLVPSILSHPSYLIYSVPSSPIPSCLILFHPYCPSHLSHPTPTQPIPSYPSHQFHPVSSYPILSHPIHSVLSHSILQHPGPSHPTSTVTPYPIHSDTPYLVPFCFIHSTPLLSLIPRHPILSILCHPIPFYQIPHI